MIGITSIMLLLSVLPTAYYYYNRKNLEKCKYSWYNDENSYFQEGKIWLVNKYISLVFKRNSNDAYFKFFLEERDE